MELPFILGRFWRVCTGRWEAANRGGGWRCKKEASRERPKEAREARASAPGQRGRFLRVTKGSLGIYSFIYSALIH